MYKSHCKNTKTWMSKPVSSIKPTRTVEIFTYENFINKLRIQNLKSQSYTPSKNSRTLKQIQNQDFKENTNSSMKLRIEELDNKCLSDFTETKI